MFLRHRVCFFVLKHGPDDDHNAVEHFGACFRCAEEMTVGGFQRSGSAKGKEKKSKESEGNVTYARSELPWIELRTKMRMACRVPWSGLASKRL